MRRGAGPVMRSVAGMAVFCTGCLLFVGCSGNSKDVTRQEVCPSLPPVTPSTVSPMVVWNAKYRALDDKRVQLEHAGRRLTDELNSARAGSFVDGRDNRRQAPGHRAPDQRCATANPSPRQRASLGSISSGFSNPSSMCRPDTRHIDLGEDRSLVRITADRPAVRAS